MFVYDVLMSGGDSYEPYISNDIHGTFCEMIDMGATSLWEVVGGEERFQCAASLCHGWSAVLNYFAGARVLGVRPLSLGFKTFEVAPRTLGLLNASGVIPTPHGEIIVRWQDDPEKNELKLFLKYPEGLEARIVAPNNRKLIQTDQL